MKNVRFKNSKRAFTIVELVIVIAVISILAAVLIPTFTSIIEKAEESRRLQQLVNKQKEDFIESMLGKDDSTLTPEGDDYVVFEFTHFDVVHYRVKIKPGTYDLDEGYDDIFEVERWINEADVSKIPEEYFRKELTTNLGLDFTIPPSVFAYSGASIVDGCRMLPGYDKSSVSPQKGLNNIFAKFSEFVNGKEVAEDPPPSGILYFNSQVWGEYSKLDSDSKELLKCTLVKSDGKYKLMLKPIAEGA
ncbi:MAG: type II secretion system protein [Clostridia bacterium]|nr:type II secretion system protein [Clostridia bacterium]